MISMSAEPVTRAENRGPAARVVSAERTARDRRKERPVQTTAAMTTLARVNRLRLAAAAKAPAVAADPMVSVAPEVRRSAALDRPVKRTCGA
jgi:hypothetical protein